MDEVIKKSWAAACVNQDFVFIETYSGYRGGRPDPNGEKYELPTDVTNFILGQSLQNALKSSRFLHPYEHPDFFNNERILPAYQAWVKATMDRHSYKTKRVMFGNMKWCNIESFEGKIEIRPTIHEKLEAWSREKDDGIENVYISTESLSEEVGAALRLAFSRCK